MSKKLRELDRSKPYAEVFGLPGARYEQDDILFNAGGIEVRAKDLSPVIDDDPPIDPADDNEDGVGQVTVVACPEGCQCRVCAQEALQVARANIASSELPVSSQEPETINTNYETMHWTQLRKAVEMFGGEWTDRESAIAFLRGHKAAA